MIFKVKDRVIAKNPPFKGQIGTIKHIDGSYIDVNFDGTSHIAELYPNELSLAPEETFPNKDDVELFKKIFDTSIVDVSRKMFVKGVCLTYAPDKKDEGEKLAEKAWESTYKSEVETMLGFE